MAIQVNQYQQIRMLYEQEKWSIRKIARELHCSRNTVRRYIEGDAVPWERKPGSGRKSVITEEIEEFIESCFAEDEQENLRKQKHTAKRIHDRIQEEMGICVAESTIRNYVSQKRQKTKTAFIPLVFAPGEAIQIDWGCAKTYVAEERLDVNYFCMRECSSGAMFTMAFMRQNEESFLEAIRAGLEFFGGSPKRMIFDNAKVGVKEGFGKYAKAQDRYAELAAHYAFRTDFCNPAEGHEKGLVENLVEYVRNNFLVPVPRVVSVQELNDILLKKCRHYNSTHYIRGREFSVSQMLQVSQQAFIPLPPYRYDTSRTQKATVNDFAMVRFDSNQYSVPYRLVGRAVTVKAYGLTVEIHFQNKLVACYDRFFGRGKSFYRLEHYIELLERRPRSVWNAKPVRSTVPPQLMQFLEKLDNPKQVVAILRSYLTEPERVLQIVAFSGDFNQAALTLNRTVSPITLPQKDIPVAKPNLKQYDSLLQRRSAI